MLVLGEFGATLPSLKSRFQAISTQTYSQLAPVEESGDPDPFQTIYSTQSESQIAPSKTLVPVVVEEPAPTLFNPTPEAATTPTVAAIVAQPTVCSPGFYWDSAAKVCRPMASQAEAALPSGAQTFMEPIRTEVVLEPAPAGQAPAIPVAPAPAEAASGWDKKVFSDFTVKHALIGAAISIAGILTIRALR